MTDQIQLKNRLSWWWEKAKNVDDIWILFILYWMIFDSYLTENSRSTTDKDKIQWFLKTDNEINKLVSCCWQISDLEPLKQLSPISSNRPQDNRQVVINNVGDMADIVWAIYQARCNLVHGSKDLNNERDIKIIKIAGGLIKKLIDCWFNKINKNI